MLGEIDEGFAAELAPGDTFMFAGEIVRMEGLAETELYVSRSNAKDPKVPSYPGGKFPLSTHLAARVRRMLADPSSWHRLPPAVADWLAAQQRVSIIPAADEVLVETFPRSGRHYLIDLSVRRTDRTPDARHAADAAAPSRRRAAARLRRHRLRALRVGRARHRAGCSMPAS